MICYSFVVEFNYFLGFYKVDIIVVFFVGMLNVYFKRKEKIYNMLGKFCNLGIRYEFVYYN